MALAVILSAVRFSEVLGVDVTVSYYKYSWLTLLGHQTALEVGIYHNGKVGDSRVSNRPSDAINNIQWMEWWVF